MRVVCTGQTGLRKDEFLKQLIQLPDSKQHVTIFSLGEYIEKEARDAHRGDVQIHRILQKPLHELNLLRRSAFKDILMESGKVEDCILNTHTVFRWRRGVFEAFDLDQLTKFKPDIIVTLIDDFPEIFHAVRQDKFQPVLDLRDIVVWREEEVIMTRLLARLLNKPFYVYLRKAGPEGLHRLMFERSTRKAYLSFPITRLKLRGEQKLVTEVESFKTRVGKGLITFDPYQMREYELIQKAELARRDRKRQLEVTVDGDTLLLGVDDVLALRQQIEGQILARDFALIDQSDMVVAYFVLDDKGIPEISAGGQTELTYAFGLTRETYVICENPDALSPWVTNHATEIFVNVKQAEKYFLKKGYITA